jgi:hypothetical protein
VRASPTSVSSTSGNPDACLDAIRRQFARRVDKLTDDLAGDDPPGEGYLAKAGRLTAARCQAEEVIRQEYGPFCAAHET